MHIESAPHGCLDRRVAKNKSEFEMNTRSVCIAFGLLTTLALGSGCSAGQDASETSGAAATVNAGSALVGTWTSYSENSRAVWTFGPSSEVPTPSWSAPLAPTFRGTFTNKIFLTTPTGDAEVGTYEYVPSAHRLTLSHVAFDLSNQQNQVFTSERIVLSISPTELQIGDPAPSELPPMVFFRMLNAP